MKYLNFLLVTVLISGQTAAQTIQFVFTHNKDLEAPAGMHLNVTAVKDNFTGSHRTNCLDIKQGQSCKGKVWSALGAPDPSGNYEVSLWCQQNPWDPNGETVTKWITLSKTTETVVVQATCQMKTPYKIDIPGNIQISIK